jgi:hypothetical protein
MDCWSDDIDDNTAFRDFAEHLNMEPVGVRGACRCVNPAKASGLNR